jgi:hypothetical protein
MRTSCEHQSAAATSGLRMLWILLRLRRLSRLQHKLMPRARRRNAASLVNPDRLRALLLVFVLPGSACPRRQQRLILRDGSDPFSIKARTRNGRCGSPNRSCPPPFRSRRRRLFPRRDSYLCFRRHHSNSARDNPLPKETPAVSGPSFRGDVGILVVDGYRNARDISTSETRQPA